MLCLVVRGRVHAVLINYVVQERPPWGNLSNAGGAYVGETFARWGILTTVNFCNDM
jgi:hypothetical protein